MCISAVSTYQKNVSLWLPAQPRPRLSALVESDHFRLEAEWSLSAISEHSSDGSLWQKCTLNSHPLHKCLRFVCKLCGQLARGQLAAEGRRLSSPHRREIA